ncbi:MAG: hypothetical protein B7Z05_04375 [Thiotrichales bacterium 32-46-8]|jgi:hypothetical protein|nr:hypothetical protein [Gammaproteobacteria bacterium]OYX06636.1 MAG: hypothetical protein B7Z05_04375 [Thiotrichales bacterium 32-46-8]OYY24756.1 MAG: hypothetical protein B7Y68_02575 [Thiotrichales bacterium 35-46-9]OYZ03827.1 MAG: hypothetical protein B7Y29_07675 [Thiotrichales bacterium 16-46-22]OZA18348.1 MAG: hypothetical protein B7X85_03745 [Thiotrichales bacterium 17-46-47]OZA95861.1 MAG: hypothetical protein B7X52_06390 [Thiotrichales bacterium 34-46-19]UCG17938.1 MAG: hypothetical 
MNLLKFLAFVVVAVVLPFAVILGIYFDLLPSSIAVVVGTIGTAAAIATIVGMTMFLLWSDIKTGRYSNKKV